MVEKEPVCPDCGSSRRWKNGLTALGKQRYKCIDCGRNYIDPKEHNYQPAGHVCPRCKSVNVIRQGWTLLTRGRRKQRLKCNDCNKDFHQPEEEVGG